MCTYPQYNEYTIVTFKFKHLECLITHPIITQFHKSVVHKVTHKNKEGVFL